MATSKNISSNRRKSIAVPVHNKPSLVPKNRRRAHSIIPGTTLSPFSKARRSLAPRKSILKSSIVPNVDPSSQQSTSSLEDHNSMRSMEITQDFTALLHDNTTRKSFARRVSFADDTDVRLFEKSRRQRSSIPNSIAGSEDMDMTTVMNSARYPATGSAILEEEFDYEDNFDNDDMDITEAIPGNFARRRPSSLDRRPLPQLSSPPEIDEEVNWSRSDHSNESMLSATSDEHSRIMDFTVPLGQSLRPAIQDAAWLALKQVTHSGHVSELEPTSDDSVQHDEGVGMDLEDAMERLCRARDSLPQSSQLPLGQPDDTFTSTEDSFEDDNDEGNKTLNLSRVIGRLSTETNVNARMSIDSNMEESEVYGNIAQSMPGQSLQSPDRPTIAQELESAPVQQPPSTTSVASSAIPRSSVFTRPISPSKSASSPSKLSRTKPTFSAAFAPPVTKPSPKKSIAPPTQIPAKRPRTTNEDDVDTAKPSPAKKRVLANKWKETTAAKEEVRNSSHRQTVSKLSPSKKALFQDAGGVVNSLATAPSNGIKRPSGYFARRKSLAVSASHSRAFQQPITPAAVTPPIDASDIVSQGIEIDVEATQQWRDAVHQDEYIDEDESPAISISQFFQMTGIKYMDELAAPRRSVHAGMQPIPQSRNVSEIPVAEFVTAMAIDVPQLDLYSRVSKDLEAWIEKSKVVFAQAEEEAAKVTPELFIEYARADEVGREELGHQLTLIRTHTRYLARSDWYDWKLQWVEGLCHTASEAFKSLEEDARALEEPKKAADALIPDLEKEYEEVMQELEKEQDEVREIESCDQDYLNELKASIAEQNIEIEALKAELSEAIDQSKWVQEKLHEIEAQKSDAQNTIRTAERVLQMKTTSTRSEVFRLKAELEALEDLHMVRITKVSTNLFEYVYASTLLVSIPCADFRPISSQVRITRSGKDQTRYKDEFPKLSTFFLASANYLINEGEDLNVREIVHRLADFWSASSQLRSQLVLLKVKYPVDILVSSAPRDTHPCFKAKAQVLFPSVKAKASVYFTFSFDTLTQWPLSLGSLNCDVEVTYGPVERSAILKAITDRLSQVTPAENYACLLDSCIEAQDMYH